MPTAEAIETRSQEPQTTTVVTRTPDGAVQSTVTVTVQVTTTLGPAGPVAADPVVSQRSPNDDDTDVPPDSKGSGLGVERRS